MRPSSLVGLRANAHSDFITSDVVLPRMILGQSLQRVDPRQPNRQHLVPEHCGAFLVPLIQQVLLRQPTAPVRDQDRHRAASDQADVANRRAARLTTGLTPGLSAGQPRRVVDEYDRQTASHGHGDGHQDDPHPTLAGPVRQPLRAPRKSAHVRPPRTQPPPSAPHDAPNLRNPPGDRRLLHPPTVPPPAPPGNAQPRFQPRQTPIAG